MIKKLNNMQLKNISGGKGSFCIFPDGKVLVSYFDIESQSCDWRLFDNLFSASKACPNIKSFSFRPLNGDPSPFLISIREKVENSKDNCYRETTLSDSDD